MSEQEKIRDYIKSSIIGIEESIKCTKESFHELMVNMSGSSYNRRLAMAILNIETSFNILKRIEEELTSHLLENLAKKEIDNE